MRIKQRFIKMSLRIRNTNSPSQSRFVRSVRRPLWKEEECKIKLSEGPLERDEGKHEKQTEFNKFIANKRVLFLSPLALRLATREAD